jgi:hypothetical protein
MSPLDDLLTLKKARITAIVHVYYNIVIVSGVFSGRGDHGGGKLSEWRPRQRRNRIHSE